MRSPQPVTAVIVIQAVDRWTPTGGARADLAVADGSYIGGPVMEITTRGCLRGWLGIRMPFGSTGRTSRLSLHSFNSASGPIPLGTGDFESVSFPRPPKVPVFHRAPNAAPYGRAGAHAYPAHYSPAPSAPPSLAPVAMNTSRDPGATGRQRAQETFVIRQRPNTKTGVAILLAGALVGGVLGIAARARENAAEAALAAQQLEQQQEAEQLQQQQPAAPPPPVTQIPAPIPAPIAANPAGPTVIHSTPPTVPPQVYAHAPSPAPATTVVIPPSSAVVVPPPAPKSSTKQVRAAAPSARGKHMIAAKVSPPPKAKKDKDDGYTVASASSSSDLPKEREAKPKKARKTATDDATAVLKAAMGATENTL